MSIQHIVWLQAKPNTKNQEIVELLKEVEALTESIPDIEKITSGKNFTDRANGYTHGTVITLKDRQALQIYLKHPKHVNIAQKLVEKANVIAMDIETC